MTGEFSLVLIFFAGLLSFLSPCVLPLIPSYLSILGGAGPGENRRLIWIAAGFVMGFSAVFITFGILISATFFLMGGISAYINIASGIIVIILGLNLIFDFLSFLNHEKRPFLHKLNFRGKQTHQGGHGTTGHGAGVAFIAGAAFGTGWTPCIGPVLAGILLIAGQSGQTLKAAFYLALYSAGLALPFLLAAVFFDFFMKGAVRFRSHLRLIQRVSGILLILMGTMILLGQYSALSEVVENWIFDYIDWAETKALPFRLLAGFFAWKHTF